MNADIPWHVYECPPVDCWNGAGGVEVFIQQRKDGNFRFRARL